MFIHRVDLTCQGSTDIAQMWLQCCGIGLRFPSSSDRKLTLRSEIIVVIVQIGRMELQKTVIIDDVLVNCEGYRVDRQSAESGDPEDASVCDVER